MRRGVTAVVATVLGTGLMVGAKLGHAANTQEIAAPAADDVHAGTAPDPGTSATPASTGTPAAGAGSPSARPPATSKPAASRPAPSPSTRPSARYKDGTYTGPAVRERFGSITVTITVSGGRIAQAAATCACSGQSQSISQNAFGKLNPRVLAAQSATVASVSGATYTSTAYAQSLAAAVDAART
ncbi:FMN-binding protein [Hamadaea tsunoensis]|uniref:FMN-binding protein n=1 Tax=Hamadaea tsunoensis TaxID=53368 RepID=UPI000420CAF9|nr:FMN-binding protein [Hamadaea tsunoensis]